MKTLAVFISGHGFGHASRDVEVLNALAARRTAPWRLVIRSAVDPALLARTLRAPYVLRPGACDTGVLQTDSLTHDDAATLAAASAFDREWSDRIARETDALGRDGVALVLGDIPPLAFEVAARVGVPGIALGNFTWDWIYETHDGFLPDGAALLDRIRAAYGRATMALRLPFAAGFEVFPAVRDVPLVARRATIGREETRRRLGLPLDRPTVLLSFGGYGLAALDLARLDCLGTWTVVTTSRSLEPRSARPLPHIHTIAEDRFADGTLRYEDLVAAADVVVTKPGYGIIAECAANGTAMLYTSRGRFREYDLLVEQMPRYLRCRFLPQADVFAGRWRQALEELRAAPPPPERLDPTGAEVVAGIVDDLLG